MATATLRMTPEELLADPEINLSESARDYWEMIAQDRAERENPAPPSPAQAREWRARQVAIHNSKQTMDRLIAEGGGLGKLMEFVKECDENKPDWVHAEWHDPEWQKEASCTKCGFYGYNPCECPDPGPRTAKSSSANFYWDLDQAESWAAFEAGLEARNHRAEYWDPHRPESWQREQEEAWEIAEQRRAGWEEAQQQTGKATPLSDRAVASLQRPADAPVSRAAPERLYASLAGRDRYQAALQRGQARGKGQRHDEG